MDYSKSLKKSILEKTYNNNQVNCEKSFKQSSDIQPHFKDFGINACKIEKEIPNNDGCNNATNRNSSKERYNSSSHSSCSSYTSNLMNKETFKNNTSNQNCYSNRLSMDNNQHTIINNNKIHNEVNCDKYKILYSNNIFNDKQFKPDLNKQNFQNLNNICLESNEPYNNILNTDNINYNNPKTSNDSLYNILNNEYLFYDMEEHDKKIRKYTGSTNNDNILNIKKIESKSLDKDSNNHIENYFNINEKNDSKPIKPILKKSYSKNSEDMCISNAESPEKLIKKNFYFINNKDNYKDKLLYNNYEKYESPSKFSNNKIKNNSCNQSEDSKFSCMFSLNTNNANTNYSENKPIKKKVSFSLNPKDDINNNNNNNETTYNMNDNLNYIFNVPETNDSPYSSDDSDKSNKNEVFRITKEFNSCLKLDDKNSNNNINEYNLKSSNNYENIIKTNKSVNSLINKDNNNNNNNNNSININKNINLDTNKHVNYCNYNSNSNDLNKNLYNTSISNNNNTNVNFKNIPFSANNLSVINNQPNDPSFLLGSSVNFLNQNQFYRNTNIYPQTYNGNIYNPKNINSSINLNNNSYINNIYNIQSNKIKSCYINNNLLYPRQMDVINYANNVNNYSITNQHSKFAKNKLSSINSNFYNNSTLYNTNNNLSFISVNTNSEENNIKNNNRIDNHINSTSSNTSLFNQNKDKNNSKPNSSNNMCSSNVLNNIITNNNNNLYYGQNIFIPVNNIRDNFAFNNFSNNILNTTNNYNTTKLIDNKKSASNIAQNLNININEKKTASNNKIHIDYESLSDKELALSLRFLLKEQAGCRYIQRKMEENIIFSREFVFNNIKLYLLDLINDQFGNYAVQKLIEKSNTEIFGYILATVRFIYNTY